METKDNLGRITLSEKDCVNLLLNGMKIDSVYIDDLATANKYNDTNEEYFGFDSILKPLEEDVTFEEYHQTKADTWLIPDKYKDINIKDFVLAKTSKPEEVARVELEYALYEERGLIDILRCMVFLIDYFRENDIIWGVGRGSSVSSYILYLIGVHKINSILYDLDITEFLK